MPIAQQFALAAVLVSKFAVCWQADELDCATATRQGPPSISLEVCRREFERGHEPATGVRLANALRETGNLDDAAATANGLLATAARSDALFILGKVAIQRKQPQEARSLLESARELHREEARPGPIARDDQALAGLYVDREQFAEALSLLDECITSSRAGGEPTVESYCHISAARVLWLTGYFELAQQELDRAAPLASSDRNRANLELERGNLDQELSRGLTRAGHDAQAIVAFEKAIELASRAQLPEIALTAELNLAYSLAEVRRVDDADRHLAIARTLDRKHEHDDDQTRLAARIAYRRGNFTLAASLGERAYTATGDHDDRMDVAAMLVRVALARSDFTTAEAWARRGIEDAEATRRAQTAVELRPWVLTSRREPYELRFVALAAAGRIDDALAALDQWQGRTLVDALARPSPKPLALRGVATRIASLGMWFPAHSTAPFVAADPQRERAALKTIDLLALVVADGAVWRVTSNHGEVGIRKVDSFARLEDRLARFRARPTDRALADELGALVLDPTMARSTRDVLYVLLDGPLGALPFAALRFADHPIIALRPVARVTRLPEGACTPATPTQHATVIGDPRGDLPAARREANEVAAALGAVSSVGAAATSAKLFASGRDDILHVAVHGEIESGGGTLAFYDQGVSALEISAHRLGPPLVVLSTCVTAAAHDAELADSLAIAFLAAGSQHVVAAVTAVSDEGARELVTRFYHAGGVADPVRALATIQSELAATDNTDWPNFAVFGRDLCSPP